MISEAERAARVQRLIESAAAKPPDKRDLCGLTEKLGMPLTEVRERISEAEGNGRRPAPRENRREFGTEAEATQAPQTFELTDEQRQVVVAAAALSPIEYGRARSTLAKKLGCRVRDLDAEVAVLGPKSGNAGDKTLQGSALVLTDPELWPQPVDGSELLNEMKAVFNRFLTLADAAVDAVTLWAVHAHALDAFQVSPILAITSPVPECGKTTALRILSALTPRPMPTANLTPAVVFRVVEEIRPTLLVDEADSFLGRNDELRGILNSGHERRFAVSPRCVGDNHEVRTFRTWAAKAIAMIGKLPPTLASRSIEIAMKRRTGEEEGEELRGDRLDEFDPLCRRAWTWAQANLHSLRQADPPVQLRNRAADNWRPLLAIADQAGGGWPERARLSARLLSGATIQEDDTVAIQLLARLKEIFERRDADRLSTAEILRELIADEEAPTGPGGRDLNSRDLARHLNGFGIGSQQVRFGDKTLKGYFADDFADDFARYLPADPKHAKQAPKQADDLTFQKRNTDSLVSDRQPRESPQSDCIVSDVSDSNGGLWEEAVE